MISRNIIETILDTARIEEVVSEFVSLKKRGKNYIGLCPFHQEKTPSFTVSPSKGIFKCFGCGKGGDSASFIMEHEHYSYPEAIRYLARKYNIEIVEEEEAPELAKERDEKEILFNIHSFAGNYFKNLLHHNEQGKAIGMTYLYEREFSDEVITVFEIGYCLDQRDAFTRHALKNGYQLPWLVKSGLTIEKDGEYIDRFRSRVMFPIHNLTGRIIGFGGRILLRDTSKPKYINSPETDIYNKSKVLYGIHFARNAIVSMDNCYLVEGYTDVISLYQAGIKNVVASSGTSLTIDQIKLLRRFTNNITILYDGDEAGLKASFRGIDLVLEQGMNVKIVLFPEGEDPDSFSRKNRPAETKAFITNNAVDFIKLKTRLLFDEVKDDPTKKAALIKDVLSSIALIPDMITRSLYIKECSRIMVIEENSLVFELNRILRNKFKANLKEQDVELPEEQYRSPVQVDAEKTDSCEYQEKALIRILLIYGSNELLFVLNEGTPDATEYRINVARFIVDDLLNDEIKFENPVYELFFNEYRKFVNDDKLPSNNYFINHKNAELRNLAVEFLSSSYELSENWKKYRIYINGEEDKLKETIISTILSLKARKVKQKLKETEAILKNPAEGADLEVILAQYKTYKTTYDEINKALGRIITL